MNIVDKITDFIENVKFKKVEMDRKYLFKCCFDDLVEFVDNSEKEINELFDGNGDGDCGSPLYIYEFDVSSVLKKISCIYNELSERHDKLYSIMESLTSDPVVLSGMYQEVGSKYDKLYNLITEKIKWIVRRYSDIEEQKFWMDIYYDKGVGEIIDVSNYRHNKKHTRVPDTHREGL